MQLQGLSRGVDQPCWVDASPTPMRPSSGNPPPSPRPKRQSTRGTGHARVPSRPAPPIWRQTTAQRLYPAEAAGRPYLRRGPLVGLLLAVAVAQLDHDARARHLHAACDRCDLRDRDHPRLPNTDLIRRSCSTARRRFIRPRLSSDHIVIACFNEEGTIEETLDYAVQADYPGELGSGAPTTDPLTTRARLPRSASARRPDCPHRPHGGKANTLSRARERTDSADGDSRR